MRAESNVKPSEKFVLENYVDGNVDIVFFDDIKEVEKEIYEDQEIKKIIVYQYQYYRMTQKYRTTLENDIEKNYSQYILEAKYYEKHYTEKAITERNWRNSELDKTDKYLLEDFPVKYEKNTILKYREALREYPEQEGFPYEAIRPKIEDFI